MRLTVEDFRASDPPTDFAVPGLGIACGPINMLVGESFVSKSMVTFSAGLAVALGRPVWGRWDSVKGPWLHLDLEQGRRQTKNRILRMARGMGLQDEDLFDLVAQGDVAVDIFPDVRLDSHNATAIFTRLFEGFRLITIDSLRPIAGRVDENSSSIRNYLDVLAAASDVSRASAWLIHHTGKPEADPKKAPDRRHMARGSSGIRDALQTQLVATGEGWGRALVTHEKTRELRDTVQPFMLLTLDVEAEDDPSWGLVVECVDPVIDLGEGGGSGGSKDASPSPQDRLREVIRLSPGGVFAGPKAALQEACKLGTKPFENAVFVLTTTGELVREKHSSGLRWSLRGK